MISDRMPLHCQPDTEGADAEDTRPQVLVVEDDRTVRDITVWLLDTAGYRVLAAENGATAKQLLSSQHPILIISDLHMPLCDGWELLTFCHAKHPEMPVMIVSGDGLGHHPEIEQWASGFVAKPFTSRQFFAVLDKLIPRNG